MKYYSEVLKKNFDTVEDLELAEKEVEEKALTAKQEKKELANTVKVAEEELSSAYTRYELAKKEADKVLEDAKAKYQEILKPAQEDVRAAEKAKWAAISNFNKKYGTYTRVYTGDDALKEITRANSLFDNFFEPFSIFKF